MHVGAPIHLERLPVVEFGGCAREAAAEVLQDGTAAGNGGLVGVVGVVAVAVQTVGGDAEVWGWRWRWR